jgi:iron complex outermembrane receptor protein
MRYLILLSLLIWPAIYAQSIRLNGIITGQNAEPLSEAVIELNPGNRITTSDEDGAFIFSPLPTGEYSLTVQFVGYKTYERKLKLEKDTSLEIQLEEYLIEARGIITTAMRAKREKTPVSYSEMDKKELEELLDVQDVPMVLQNNPGVYAFSETGTGIGYSHIKIRGFSEQRLNVMINGIPFNDPESKGIYWVDLPDLLNNAEDVQIQRGVGFTTNGTAAFGGSINIRTKAMGTVRSASFEAGSGSYNTRKYSAAFGSGLVGNHLAFYGRVSQIKSDGYRYKTASELYSWFFSAAYLGETTIIRANIYGGKEITQQAWNGANPEMIAVDRRANDLKFSNEIDNYTQPHFELLLDHRFSSRADLSAGLFFIEGEGYYEQFKKAGKYPEAEILLPDSMETDKFIQKWLDNDHYGAQATLHLSSSLGETYFGLSGRYYLGDHFGKLIQAKNVDFEVLDPPLEFYFNRGTKIYASGFINHLWPVNSSFSITADAQLRYIYYERDQKKMTLYKGYRFDVSNLFFNPKIGILYSPSNNLQLYASAGISHSEPTDDDYFDAKDPDAVPNFEHISLEQSTNPNIKNESVTDFELGMRYDYSELLRADINFYAMLFNNEIIANGSVDDEGNPIHVNADNSLRSGIEIALSGEWHNLFYALNHAYSYNRLSSYTEYVDEFDESWNWLGSKEYRYEDVRPAFAPEIILNNRIGYRLSGFSLSLIHNYVSEQYLDNTENSAAKVNSYNIVNLSADYIFKNVYGGRITVTLKVNNLLNEEYEQPAFVWWKWYQGGNLNYDSRYYVGAPINYYIGLKYSF